MSNPLSGLYRTADDRYLSFVMLQPGKFWADVCHHIDRPELAGDPRFADAARIDANTEAGVARPGRRGQLLSQPIPLPSRSSPYSSGPSTRTRPV